MTRAAGNLASAIGDVIAAVQILGQKVGCGDGSCMFERPTGMHTNGGCRCIGARAGDVPGIKFAVAKLYRAARELERAAEEVER